MASACIPAYAPRGTPACLSCSLGQQAAARIGPKDGDIPCFSPRTCAIAVRQMGGMNGVAGQTLEQKKKLLWGAKKAETVQTVSRLVNQYSANEQLRIYLRCRHTCCLSCVAAAVQALDHGAAAGINRWDVAEFTTEEDKAKFQKLMVCCECICACDVRH